MKKLFLLFILTSIPFLYGTAQEEAAISAGKSNAEETHGLVGVWQMCILVPNPENPEDIQLRRTPAFKFLNKDGSFYNMVLSQQTSNITALGSFEINSEDSYTENVDQSYTNPNDNNRKNRLNYELTNEGRFLLIKYFTTNSAGEAGEARELWVKVEPGNPFQQK
ncbi:MAG: DUF4488 domain-containing protein [Bacteroidales bacterium]|nr:DUF4488 domain-containing protein [Bacteroidales bacterium]